MNISGYEWSIKVKREFIEKLDTSIEIIKNQPEIFPESKKGKTLRKCIITNKLLLIDGFKWILYVKSLQMKLKKSNIIVLMGLTFSLFQFLGCSPSNNNNVKNLRISQLESENDSLKNAIFEKTYQLNSNIVPTILMKNSFIHLGDSSEILTIIGLDSIPETKAKILLGTEFKNQGVKNVYDTIVCDGTIGKIPIYGDEIGSDTIFGVYILERGEKTSVHPFNISFDILK